MTIPDAEARECGLQDELDSISLDKVCLGTYAEPADKEGLTVGTFVSLANDTIIKVFRKGPPTRELRKRQAHETLESFLGEKVYRWVVLRGEDHL